eukprot:jgi/Picre1/31420/NNA_006772.t1
MPWKMFSVEQRVEPWGHRIDAARVAMESLFVTTRIDHPTEGLVIIGKNSKFVGRFNASMNGRIQKWYRAAVLVPKDNHDARIRDILGDMTHRAIMNFKLKDCRT